MQLVSQCTGNMYPLATRLVAYTEDPLGLKNRIAVLSDVYDPSITPCSLHTTDQLQLASLTTHRPHSCSISCLGSSESSDRDSAASADRAYLTPPMHQ